MYCKQCHYSLIGLDRWECPECGRSFIPNDASTFDLYPWSPKIGIFQWLRFVAVIITSLVSSFMVWKYGEDLLYWHYGRQVGFRLRWGMRRFVDGYEIQYLVGGLFALSGLVFAIFAMRRSKLPAHVRLMKVSRCIAFAAATWWMGWYLAMQFGYILFPM